VIRILLVDDHASTREPLAYMLEQEPDLTVVAQAGSLAEARQALAEVGAEVDVAVVDLGLPDGSGEELIGGLRAANPRAVALVLTYFSDQERLARAVQAGASGVLHKSASVTEVMDAVRQLDAGEPLLSLQEVFAALQLVDQQRQKDRETRLAFAELTDRELEVLQALADGQSDKEISEHFHISLATVRTHVTNVLAKFQATSRLQALVLAVRHGIVTID
jgi:DNA-binding NarL/FixJ family response regulator